MCYNRIIAESKNFMKGWRIYNIFMLAIELRYYLYYRGKKKVLEK